MASLPYGFYDCQVSARAVFPRGDYGRGGLPFLMVELRASVFADARSDANPQLLKVTGSPCHVTLLNMAGLVEAS